MFLFQSELKISQKHFWSFSIELHWKITQISELDHYCYVAMVTEHPGASQHLMNI